MPYIKDITHFPGDIYFFTVNNRHTRAKFCKLDQSFSQHLFMIVLYIRISFIFALSNVIFTKILKIFVKVMEHHHFFFLWRHPWMGVWKINFSYSDKIVMILSKKYVSCFKNKLLYCSIAKQCEERFQLS